MGKHRGLRDLRVGQHVPDAGGEHDGARDHGGHMVGPRHLLHRHHRQLLVHLHHQPSALHQGAHASDRRPQEGPDTRHQGLRARLHGHCAHAVHLDGNVHDTLSRGRRGEQQHARDLCRHPGHNARVPRDTHQTGTERQDVCWQALPLPLRGLGAHLLHGHGRGHRLQLGGTGGARPSPVAGHAGGHWSRGPRDQAPRWQGVLAGR
mmetsp:Transcript_138996/g.387672  ORF Transcript_138996/g.387672 Transcript_138996/m.387672 type:complete len:206 (+) Transcript_138996:736-1353(+)